MDLVDFVKAKAHRCRDLARLQEGDAARGLLEAAEQLETDAATLERRNDETVLADRSQRHRS